ncbi:MAG: hypothetical protein ACPGXL_04680, partial [Chitinophagales bacterium]
MDIFEMPVIYLVTNIDQRKSLRINYLPRKPYKFFMLVGLFITLYAAVWAFCIMFLAIELIFPLLRREL